MGTIPLPDGVNHVVTFAEYARVGGELDAARTERDRLAAENAELRARAARWKRIARLEFRKFRDWKEYGEGRRADLTAANATLDALRELCGPNKTISNRTCMKMVDILNPQPAAMAEEKNNGN